MKPWPRFLLAVLAFGAFLLLVKLAKGAQERFAPAGPPRVSEIIMRPIYAMNGVLVAHHVKATFQRIVAHPSGQVDSEVTGSVEFDLIKNENLTVVLGDEVYDYRELGDLAIVIAEQEWKKTMPDPLPTRRRKAMRVPTK